MGMRTAFCPSLLALLEADLGSTQGHGYLLEMRSRGGTVIAVYKSRLRLHGGESHYPMRVFLKVATLTSI